MIIPATIFTAVADHDLRYDPTIDQLRNLVSGSKPDWHNITITAIDILVHQGKHYCAFAILCQALADNFSGLLQALEVYHAAIIAGVTQSWDMRTMPEATAFLDRALAKKCLHFELTHNLTVLNAMYDLDNRAWRNNVRLQFIATQVSRMCRRIANDIEAHCSLSFERLAKIMHFIRYE